MLGHLAAQPCPVQGVLDILIRTDDELIPVDYKFTEGDVALNHVHLLAAYALRVEEHFRLPARRGFCYLVPQRRACELRTICAQPLKL